ncbi:MAG: glycoside hydrolase family 127 protein [Lachnospiraceae bacterium]|nr:glycoside hydrolase family 127 protein [Lachnospiraceae bacterium]
MSRAYELSDVLMRDAYCVNAFEKDVQYLKEFDVDRLLAGFYENAGLRMKKMRYPGWESMLIGGHTLGHYLTAAAQGYANAQIDADSKKVLYEKITALIDGLLECQRNSKGKPGFVFGATIQDPSNVELQFDYVEQNKTNIITEAWVPWYTMHKILDGIVNAFELTGYQPALELASGIGDWTYGRTAGWSEETHRIVLGIEYGGMNDALYALYQNTHKEEHLKAAHAFDEEALFKKVLTGEKNVLNNRHANTTIPKFVGALNRYITLGDEAKEYLEYVEAFWDMVVKRHTYVTGGNSEWEHFGEDYVLDAERTNCNNETCNTYNMLKMTRKLFMITGKKKYAEYYERTLINAILSSQNPENGMTMYFQPMATGFYKTYGTPFDKFWCCTGSGMENFTKLNDSIYFKEDDGIIVNLFISSEVTDRELGIKLIQETDVPSGNCAKFTVRLTDGANAAGVRAKIKIRMPEWSQGGGFSVQAVQEVPSYEENGYFVAEALWRDGDTVKATFGLRVTATGLPDCDNVFAFQYGPVLLSAELGTENMIDGKTGVDVTIPTNKIVKSEYLTVLQGTKEDFIAGCDDWFERCEKPCTFKLKGTDQELTFSPHYLKTRERYGIYWYFLDETDEGEEKDLMKQRELEEKRKAGILDTVQPGYGQYELDDLHAMEDQGSIGTTQNGTTRHATPRGGFGYHMKAVPGKDHLLELHFLREDNGKLLRIRIGEEEIFNQRLHYTGKKEEYVVELPVHKELIDRSIEEREVEGEQVKTVFVYFQGGMFVESARLFGFLYLSLK